MKIKVLTVNFIAYLLMGPACLLADFGAIKSVNFAASISFGDIESLGYPKIEAVGISPSQVLLNDVNLSFYITDGDGLKRAKFEYGSDSSNPQKSYSLDDLNGVGYYIWNILIPYGEYSEPGFTFYIEAEDIYGNKSYLGKDGSSVTSLQYISVQTARQLIRTAKASGGLVVFEDSNIKDGEISINFPALALAQDEDVLLKILKNPDETSAFGITGVVNNFSASVYEISPSARELAKPAVLTLLYTDSTVIPEVENTLKIFRWDGFEWRLLGGTLDNEKNTVSASISNFGTFAVMPLISQAASVYMPKERIITPNNDGYNDYAVFDGLGSISTEIKIFDITGRQIRKINSQPYRWDGRDDDGGKVENGVYIYQFKVNGELLSGVIAVAK